MRYSVVFPAALVTLGLAAQAPENLVQRYNDGLPGVTQALKDLKYQEACDKADALVPSQRPVFQSRDISAIGRSLENGRGMLALLKLQANAYAAHGRWEKAREIHLQRVDYAKAIQQDLKGALGTQEGAWKQTLTEGQAYIAQNESKAGELGKKLLELQVDIKAFNEKKVKLDSKGLADLKSRAAQAPKDEEQLNEMKGRIASYKDAMQRHSKFAKWSSDSQRSAADQVKEAEGALGKIEGNLKGQAAEIETFNKAQNAKKPRPKVPVTGAKAWVDAVMKDHTNLTRFGTPQEQANTLHRFLVLDPESKVAAQVLANLEQGRELFFGTKGSKMNRNTKR